VRLLGRPGAALAAAAFLLGTAPAGIADEGSARRGKQLFDRPWLLWDAQDPVGPLFNARSCSACHPGGDGGAADGPALVLRTGGDATLGRQVQPLAIEGVAAEPRPVPAVEVVRVAGSELRRQRWELDRRPLAARLAPPLRGLALLALVPGAQWRSLADPDDRDGDGVSGRPGRGRFGLKAERATLAQQIGDALSLDMGLATADHSSTAGDCTPAQIDCLARAGAGLPVPGEAITRLVAFLEALRPRLPPRADVAPGAGLFAATGCGTCHAGPFVVPSDPAVTGRPSEVIAPLTDLLLHDLGDGLADPFPSDDVTASEWRTAPLWGMRSRAALLHDGRAADPREAVLWHGGEAQGSRDRFLALTPAEREQLLAFLRSL
jgi:CxxC motif-containing protein (DUF1111 family)